MKRALLQNVQVTPYTSGAAFDRNNFLSMVFAALIDTAGTLTLTFQHCDTVDGTFVNIPDMRLAPTEAVAVDSFNNPTPGVYNITAAAGILNVDVDLVGSKQFVTITASGAAATGATYAYVLGDPQYAPV